MTLTPMLAAGGWRGSTTGRTEEITSPYDGSAVGTVPRAGPADATEAGP